MSQAKSMSSTDFSRMSAVLTAFLEGAAEQVDRATGLVERTSKMSGSLFAQTVIVGWLAKADAALNEWGQCQPRLNLMPMRHRHALFDPQLSSDTAKFYRTFVFARNLFIGYTYRACLDYCKTLSGG